MTAPTTEKVAATTWTGQSLPRKEDERLLKAQGSFVDDEGMHRQGYAQFVRSPYGPRPHRQHRHQQSRSAARCHHHAHRR